MKIFVIFLVFTYFDGRPEESLEINHEFNSLRECMNSVTSSEFTDFLRDAYKNREIKLIYRYCKQKRKAEIKLEV